MSASLEQEGQVFPLFETRAPRSNSRTTSIAALAPAAAETIFAAGDEKWENAVVGVRSLSCADGRGVDRRRSQ